MNHPPPKLLLGSHGRLGRIRILSIDRILLVELVVGPRALDRVLGDLYIRMGLGVLVWGYLLALSLTEGSVSVKAEWIGKTH
jgi:hypothetical protein